MAGWPAARLAGWMARESRAAWLNAGISTDYKLPLVEGGILKVAIIQCYVLERQIGLGLVIGFFVALNAILAAANCLWTLFSHHHHRVGGKKQSFL
jgi:uncharacterized membrane protein YphA (DoxX/SURF4 family)